MSESGWRREFEYPIPLPGGGELRTLLDAGNYITSLPEKESALPEWQTTIEVWRSDDDGADSTDRWLVALGLKAKT